MTELLKNNPIALRHCLLYVFLQEKSVETAFDDFCETVGPDVVKKEEFQHWFDQFKQGKFDDKKQSIADMREVLRNDKQALRSCVMYEWLPTKKKSSCSENNALSVFAKYQNFCKVIGVKVMEDREFDFWFYRFDNGEFVLNFEIGEDKKSLGLSDMPTIYKKDKNKKKYELTDMPLDIMKNTVEYLNIVDRVALAKTSRSLKTFVEDQKLSCKKLQVLLYDGSTNVLFGNRFIQLDERFQDDCLRTIGNKHTQNGRLIRGVSHLERGVQEVQSILRLPKLHLEEFSITMEVPSYDKFVDGLELEKHDEATNVFQAALNFTHHLRAQKLRLLAYNTYPLIKFLPYFTPGYLTTLEIFIRKPGINLAEEMTVMEQWKQAKYLDAKYTMFSGPLHRLYHFKEFHIQYTKLSVEDIRQMKKILFKSSDFEKCAIKVDKFLAMDAIRHEFGDSIEGTLDIFQYSIPNSSEYFEIKLEIHNIEITRKKM